MIDECAPMPKRPSLEDQFLSHANQATRHHESAAYQHDEAARSHERLAEYYQIAHRKQERQKELDEKMDALKTEARY